MLNRVFLLITLLCIGSCEGFNVELNDPSAEVAGESISQCEQNYPGGSADPSGFWGGIGTAGDPFQICTADQLNLISNNFGVNSYFILINEIDLNFLTTPFNMITLASGSSFDGQGNTIKNLHIEDLALVTWGAGFIASVIESEIKDIVFENPTINLPAADGVGLIGDAQSAAITDIQVTGLSVTGDSFVGGVVGYIRDNDDGGGTCLTSNISSVTVSGQVTSAANAVGGIVGSTEGWCWPLPDRVTVEDSSFTGTVFSSQHVVGGIVGLAYGSEILDVTVSAVITGVNAVGGVVGETTGETNMTNATTAGQVIGTAQVGGLCGNATEDFVVLTSTTDSDVTSTLDGGRLFGRFSSAYGSSYDIATTSTGTLNGNGAGLLVGFEYP